MPWHLSNYLIAYLSSVMRRTGHSLQAYVRQTVVSENVCFAVASQFVLELILTNSGWVRL
jgi:hypothetical protein